MTRIDWRLPRFLFVAVAMCGPSLTVAAPEPPAAVESSAAEAPQPFEEPATVPEAPPSPADLHPLKLADGSSTRNDRCPVRKRPLNAKIEPVYVNQQPVGFC